MENELVTRIMEYRVKHKLTQAEFAEKAGIHRQTLMTILKGYSCSQMTEAKILFVLNSDKQ